MRRLLMWALITMLGLSLTACSTVAKHKVKKAIPGANTKGEKIAKRADRGGGQEEDVSKEETK